MYAIEVDHPLKGWILLQARYANKTLARGWLSFVRKAWHVLPLRIVKVGEVWPGVDCGGQVPVIQIEHPSTRMSLELVSVDGGWLRRWQCPTCGKVHLGRVGKTVNTMRMVMRCNGLKVNKEEKP